MVDLNAYHDVSPPAKNGKPRRKSMTKQQHLTQDFGGGIGARTCFPGRVPRTITTTASLDGDLGGTTDQPNDEKLGLLQSTGEEAAELTQSWTYSSADTTAALTSSLVSPRDSAASLSSPDSAKSQNVLLSMPLSKERSRHSQRPGQAVDGAHELHRRSQGIDSRQVQQPPTSLHLTSKAKPQVRQVMLKADTAASDGEHVPLSYRSHVGRQQAVASEPEALLDMPKPMDRSHRRRMQLEREGSLSTYEGENAPVQSSHDQERGPSGRQLTMPEAQDQSRRRGGGRRMAYDGEMEPPTFHQMQETHPVVPTKSPSRRSDSRQQPQVEQTDPGRFQSQPSTPSRRRNSRQQPKSKQTDPGRFQAQPTTPSRRHDLRQQATAEQTDVGQFQAQSTTPTRKSRGRQRPEMDPSADNSQTNSSTFIAEEVTPPRYSRNLLSMPTPQDRSHKKRLQMERGGRKMTYDGEHEPAGFRGQDAPVTPDRRQSISNPVTPTTKNRGETFKITPVRGSSNSRSDMDASDDEEMIIKSTAPPSRGTGTPYLQFNPTGPSLQVFESTPPRQRDADAKRSRQATSIDDDIDRRQSSQHISINRQNILLNPGRTNISTKHLPMKQEKEPFDEREMAMPHGVRPILRNRSASSTPQSTVDRHVDMVSQRVSKRAGDAGSTVSSSSSENLRNMMPDLMQDVQTSAPVDNKSLKSSVDMNQLAAMAQQYVQQGEYDLAIVLFGRILLIHRKKHGEIHPLVASAYHNLGMVHSQRAALLLDGTVQQNHVRQQSLECFQAAARSARDSLGKNHPNVAVSLVKIGFLLLQARQYESARVTFAEALRIRLEHYGGNPHPLVANLFNNLGICFLHLGNFLESNKNLSKALELQRHILRSVRLKCSREELRVRLLEVADTLANLGGLGLEWLRVDGTHEEVAWDAESHLSEALEIRTTVLGYAHPLVIQVKSLYDMVRAAPSTTGAKRAMTPTRGLQGMNDRMSTSPSPTHTSLSPARPPVSPAKSRDAPGSVASSPMSASRRGVEIRRPDPISPSLSRVEKERKSALSPSNTGPPIVEIVLSEDAHEADELSASRKLPDGTKVTSSPVKIPRRSSGRRVGQSMASHSTSIVPIKEGRDASLDLSLSYEAEESCLLNESSDCRFDLLSPLLVDKLADKEQNDVNVSNHEIVVVRPGQASDEKDCYGQDNAQVSTPAEGSGGVEEGIAPLCQAVPEPTPAKVRLTDKMLSKPQQYLPEIYSAASRYLKKDRHAEAHHLFTAILDCQRQKHGELHADVGSAWHNCGLVNLRSSEYDEALYCFERAVRVRKGSLGKDHPEVAISQVKAGITLLFLRKFDLALQGFNQALSIRKRALGALHPSIAGIYNNIGCVHVEFNELRDARRAFEAALDIQRNALCHSPDSGSLMFGAAGTLCNLAYLYRNRDMHQKVAVVLKEALSLQEAVVGPTHATVMSTLDGLADALTLSGCGGQAIQYYNAILSRMEKIDMPESRSHAEAVIFFKMARAHHKQNDLESEMAKLKVAHRAIGRTRTRDQSEKKRKSALENQIRAGIDRCKRDMRSATMDWI